MKQHSFKKSTVIKGLSMAVFMGACLGIQADDKVISGNAQVGDKGVSVNANADADRNANKNDGKLARTDANFIREAAKGGRMEVMMGQAAKDRASNAEVKKYGETLVKDHSKANEKLAQIASQKGLDLAKETDKDSAHDHGKMVMDLEKKTGAEFDRAFIKHALKEHKNDIQKFEKASRSAEDQDVRSFAANTLPKLREHQMEAERLARSLGIDVNVSDASAEVKADASGAPARVDIDTDRDNDAKIDTDVKVDNNKGDGKTLGVDVDGNQTRNNNADIDINRNDSKVEADVKVDNSKGDGKTLGVDVDGDQTRNNNANANIDIDSNDAKVETKVDVDTDKGDGKTLGVETRAGDNKTLGVETVKGDNKVLGVETKPGDGKTLGLNTSKSDGKLLGVFPAPSGGKNAEGSVDVDVDRNDPSVEVKTEANVGGPATVDSGSDKNATVAVYTDLPAKVQSTIKTEGGSNTSKVKKHTMNGKTVYKVEIVKDGRNRVVEVAEDGTIIKDNQAK